jgi:hypothetical protein
MTFLASAAIIYRLPIPRTERTDGTRIDWTETFREIKEGVQFVSQHALVRGVMLGLGIGIIGAGAMIPLGPSFAKEVLNGGSAAFGVLMTALGFGAAFGVVTLLWLQNRLPRATVFTFAVIGVGLFLVLAASFSELAPAALLIGAVGACAGGTYVTGFTVLQETTSDELRGRTFAALYTVIRLCLLVSLTISPLWADFWDWITEALFGPSQSVSIGPYSYALPGVRIALWGGGLIALGAGLIAWKSVRRVARSSPAGAAEVEEVEEVVGEPPSWVLPTVAADAEPPTLADAEPTTVADAEPPTIADVEPPTVADAEPPTLADTSGTAPATPGAVEPPTLADAEPTTVADTNGTAPATPGAVELPTVADSNGAAPHADLTGAEAPTERETG